MKKVIALAADGEFTSFDKLGGDLIKWAFVEILEDFTLGREAEWSLRPMSEKYFTKGAQEIHGISYWKATQFPERRESLISIMNWLAEIKDTFPMTMVYHGNGKLDPEWLRMTFFKEQCENSYWTAFNNYPESTLKMARDNLKQLDGYSLKEVSKYYQIELDHHNALSDARACAQIWCNIKQEIGTYTGKLL